MESARNVTEDIHILPSFSPMPGFGFVPINAFVLKAKEPVLIDTGAPIESAAFLEALRSVIDPLDLRWLWLTHPHADHLGSLNALMQEVPHLRLVTTFMGYGYLTLSYEIPLDRIYLVNPGESLDVGDRQLSAYRPPTFDDPMTTGFFDSKSKVFFSSDSFGALIPNPAPDAEAIGQEELLAGQRLWTAMDSPWLHNIDRGKFASELNVVRSMEPSRILSSHLPPATSLTESFLANLAGVPDSPPFVGPNQPALEAMLKQMTESAATAG